MKWYTGVLSLFFAVSCSTSSLESGGWVSPSAQSTDEMVVTGGGFEAETGRSSLDLLVSVRLQSVPHGAKYLRFIFPDATTKAPKETRVIRIAGAKEYSATSSPMKGLKYLDAYPVTVQISGDPEGKAIFGQLTQFVRFELPPAMQAQLGVNR